MSYNVPNHHSINSKKLIEWLKRSDREIRPIAKEFIDKTIYISYRKFKSVLYKCVNELLKHLKSKDKNVLQFFITDDDVSYKYKSSYWIISHIQEYMEKYPEFSITVVDDKKKLDFSNTIIITDDASYSGSQISGIINDNFFDTKDCNIYLLIPFISNTALDVIINGFNENNNMNGIINYSSKSTFIMRPIYEIMDKDNIVKLFKYYTKEGSNIREYPIYFDHKVADNYSSFPLIYTYGIVPNEKNKDIIVNSKSKGIPFKNIFDSLDRVVFLNNCDNTYKYDINPACPIPPYKAHFIKLKSPSSTLSKRRSDSFPRIKTV